jgi:hypothetical protein
MAVKPDRILARDQLAALQAMKQAWGVATFVGAMFWVLQKGDTLGPAADDTPTRLVPFILNWVQRDLLSKLALHNLLEKGRQIGGTTFFMLVRGLLNVVTAEGTNALLIAQSTDFAEAHFIAVRRAYRMFGVADPRGDELVNNVNISYMQNLLHTQYTNRRELYFDVLESRMTVASAEVEEVAQGPSIHNLIASEYSRWPHNPAATLANARGALVKHTGTLDIECTCNGAAGSFYEKCLLANNAPELSDAKFHFYEWYFSEDYVDTLTPVQKDEMEKDLTEDEMRFIVQIHHDLSSVAWVPGKQARVFI